MNLRPVDFQQKQQVLLATETYLRRAAALFAYRYQPVRVAFDLSGRAAGQYRVDGTGRSIRYNPYLFAKYFSDSLRNTVPHEVAHYVVDRLHGARRVRPHGEEWRQVMLALGAVPRATASYDLEGVPVRRQRRFSYRCNCREHALSTVRHNRILGNQAIYCCRACHAPLVYAGD